MITLYKPVEGHKGDTFRELCDLWAEAGYCEIRPTQTNFVWLKREGGILLYDWDRLEDLPVDWETGLFGNPTPPAHPRSFRWTYFARRPRLLEATIKKGIRRFNERKISSVFLGKIEAEKQAISRLSAGSGWEKHIELFSCPVRIGDSVSYPFTQQEYLDRLSEARFGLSLPGYGAKCNREVELLGLGTVPLVTPGVDTSGYHEPLVESVHFLRVERPEDIPRIIAECTEDRWEYLSRNGRLWYERNCSREGSWKLTLHILRQQGAFE